MPPKGSKTNGQGLKDIRSFFGGKPPASGSAGPSSSAASNSKKAQKPTASSAAILISDSDEEAPVAKKPVEPKVQSKSLAPAKIESDEDESPPPAASRKRKLAVVVTDDESDPTPPPKKTAASRASTSSVKITSNSKTAPKTTNGKASKKAVVQDDSSEEEVSSDHKPVKPTAKKLQASASSKPPAKRSRKADTEDDEDEAMSTSEEEKPKKKAKAAATKKPPPTKKAPAPKTTDAEEPAKKKFIPGPKGPPAAAGSKEIPSGDPNALAGLTFVFTGELSAFSREEAQDLAKRYGGRVTTAPSGKTSYVVLGDSAGPKKLLAIQRLNLPTIDEDGFLHLIGTRKGKLDAKALEKLEKEQEKIQAEAAAMTKREKAVDKVKLSAGGSSAVPASSQLWTTRYAPQNLREIVGNKGQVEKLQRWLEDWSKSYAAGFKKPGKDAANIFRAMLISGPPGIGKTSSAHVVAKLAGYTPIELNASDARSKKLVENSTNIHNTSLDGWMHKDDGVTLVAGVKITEKTVLIMDEVDGMSSGDRGGVGALNALIKKTRIPIICIANDSRAMKLKPLMTTCYKLPFKKPDANAVRSRIQTIVFKEKMNVPKEVIDQLVQGTKADIRQVLNLLSTWKLSQTTMNFDESKKLVQESEKFTIITPYTVTDKMLGPYMFAKTSRLSLADKMDFYFNDHSFVPLFIQENYLKPTPSRVAKMDGPDRDMKLLQLMDSAASAISDGDLVDAMIHGGQQWSLMPLHAVHSTVRPASCMYGIGTGYGSASGGISFPSWLGHNSKQGKLQRQLGDVQTRMRLITSGDRNEIRQTYIPALLPKLVHPLMEKGSGAVPDVISGLDEYYLSRDDWDTIVELGVGDSTPEAIMKQIPAATKTAFTKKYNASEHPIAFHKSTDFKPTKKIAKADMPDFEDVVDLDEADDDDGPVVVEDSDDISKDKLIKAARKPKESAKTTTTKAPAKPKGKAKK